MPGGDRDADPDLEAAEAAEADREAIEMMVAADREVRDATRGQGGALWAGGRWCECRNLPSLVQGIRCPV